MSFHQPSAWCLLLLGLLPLVWWRWSGGRTRPAVIFSGVGALEAAGSSWAVRLRWIVPALRTLALALLVVCVARPQVANQRTRVVTEGIAIQLVVDRSGSMLAEDFKLDGKAVSRLAAIRKVVEDFVAGGAGLPGRPDDLIGLITFATWADSLCPLTLDHAHLIEAVRQTKVSPDEKDQATAIGDAIALGVERMAALTARDAQRRIKSRIMVLLTDGESNAGDLDPMTAARLAASYDIRIYTIGAGSDAGFAPVPGIDPITGRRILQRIPVSIDEKTMRAIAETTGGLYFRATDSDSLEQVYARIDELERTRIDERRFTDYRELTVEPVRAGAVTLPPLLSIVLVGLLVEALLGNTRFRRVP